MAAVDQDILMAARQGGLVLTVNKRLARYLRQQYDEAMRAEGLKVWRTPNVQAYGGWLRQVSGKLHRKGHLLDETQARFLWEQVIAADALRQRIGLLRSSEAATHAQQAHRLLYDYQVDFSEEEGGEDHRAFLRWRRAWLKACREGGWQDPASLLRGLTEAVSDGSLSLPNEVWLAGFDDLTPSTEALLSAMRQQGCRVFCWTARPVSVDRTRLAACDDIVDEVRRCARWARRCLEDGVGRIGVVALDMAAYQCTIRQVFHEELAPASLLPGRAAEKSFNLSLGRPLREEGMVTAALELLASGPRIPLAQISFLLRSPFVWGYLAEENLRSIFDRELRSLRQNELPLKTILRFARDGFKKGLARCDIFATVLETLEEGLAERDKRTPGEWARHFAYTLDACRWPGDRSLDSRAFQVFSAFKELLAGMARFDALSGPVGRGEALALLRRLTTESLFQPEGSEGALQVLGPLETAGLEFDRLWILGLHDEALPAAPRPNPFVPLALQRRCGMPHADASRELDYAQRLAGRLLQSAVDVTVSYPQLLDGRSRRPSPLVENLSPGLPSLSESQLPSSLVARSAAPFENLIDSQGPALAAGRKVTGGTAILKDQALCPFRAFARHRLQADSLADGALGLDNLDRGNLVHGVLECFWAFTEDHAALSALSETALQERLANCVEETLQVFEKDRRLSIPKALRAAEARRLLALAEEWLSLERERASFRVDSLETWHREQLGQLTIQTRIDRVDRLADGSRLILDYKTGRPSLNDWLGERLLEPQLPLYSFGRGGKELSAVAFARIRRGDCAFIGLGRDEHLLPGVPAAENARALRDTDLTDWPAVQEFWRKGLLKLSEEFAAGQAAVDPVDKQKACTYCDLQPLCRIAEKGLEHFAGEAS